MIFTVMNFVVVLLILHNNSIIEHLASHLMAELPGSRIQVANILRTFLVCSLGTFTKLAQDMFLQYQLRIFSLYCLVMFPQHQAECTQKKHAGDFRKGCSGNIKGMLIAAWVVDASAWLMVGTSICENFH